MFYPCMFPPHSKVPYLYSSNQGLLWQTLKITISTTQTTCFCSSEAAGHSDIPSTHHHCMTIGIHDLFSKNLSTVHLIFLINTTLSVSNKDCLYFLSQKKGL